MILSIIAPYRSTTLKTCYFIIKSIKTSKNNQLVQTADIMETSRFLLI